MRRIHSTIFGLAVLALRPAAADEVKVLREEHDPYGYPRPGPGQTAVPLRTSFYFELGVEGAANDSVVADTVSVFLQPEGGQAVSLLEPGRHFPKGSSGRVFPKRNDQGAPSLVVFIDPAAGLRPETRYMLHVTARSEKGAQIGLFGRTWSFTTEPAPRTHALDMELDVTRPSVSWRGGFFTGFCKTSFCTSHGNNIPTYELMDAVRKRSPLAWSLQRDFWMTGTQHRPRFLSGNLPNIVRELETRRIAAIDRSEQHVALRVEDFFGHEQYGIPAGRPLSADYRRGEEVLIADGIHHAVTKVLEVDDATMTVLVEPFPTPEGGWLIAYEGPLPASEDPNAPGLFPPGGCYLRKSSRGGTPRYFWGRLDKEFDLAHRRFGRRLIPNFADAPGDLAIDGMSWTRPKDYVEYHGAVQAIAGHLIERYGASCLDFFWSVFNEPDLGSLFWRTDWDEVARFYDYTVDAILRAFEDREHDSDRVMVGGLELAAIFKTNLRLRDFLEHCSPRAAERTAARLNAAFADPRLDGKRSRRVERLCGAHAGMGSPCDFISVHSYNRSDTMAAKLIRAKEMALEVDAEYYSRLLVNSHESCPGWNPPPDPAAHDSYLGNGYFPTWCADVARRLVARASRDERYAAGETILTFWEWPNTNFGGANASTRVIHVDDDGDGREDRTVTVAMPILHFLGLMADPGERSWPLEEKTVGGHVVSGFAARRGRTLRILVYSHNPLDTESRSEQSFDVRLSVAGLKGRSASVTEYRFDSEHNSYFRLGRRLRESEWDEAALSPDQKAALEEAAALVGRGDRSSRLAGLRRLAALGPRAKSAVGLVIPLVFEGSDEELKREASAALLRLNEPMAYPASAVREVQDLSELKGERRDAGDLSPLRLSVRLDANAACTFIVEEVEK